MATKRGNPSLIAHERAEVKAHKESIAEDDRTHGEIDRMEKLIKKIAKKKGVK